MVTPVDYSSSDASVRRKRRALYGTFTAVVSLIVALAVLEALTGVPVYGVTTDEVSQRGATVDLTVHYPRVTRGQLDSPLQVQLTSPSGFAGPVVLAISSAYFDLFNVTAIRPQPTSELLDDETWTLTFDPPSGDTLAVQWDMTARAVGWFAQQTGELRADTGAEQTPTLRFVSALRP